MHWPTCMHSGGRPVAFPRGRRVLRAALIGLSLLAPAVAGADGSALDTLKGLSLEDLANLPVSILNRRPQRLADSSAAVYVLTADDIRRSGYTSIPELLRLVPGLNVARVDTAEWAISSRGFTSRFANKLLVLIDGRSVYNSLFSGVYWEAFDTLLPDIERIEVIRGPGASTWGANAVNGVINIITRHAGDTHGGLVTAHAGELQRGLAGRYGLPLGEGGYLRLYAKHDERDGLLEPDGERDDDEFFGSRVGLRGDWELSPDDALMLQGELFDANSDDPFLKGGHLMALWEHARDSGAMDSLQLYYDRFSVTAGDHPGELREDLDVVDVEYRHHFAPLGRHDLIGGIGYRWQHSDIRERPLARADPAIRSAQRFSAFVQDEIRLLDERWYLTLGTKLEHNDFSGFEVQPSIRTRWHPHRDATLWAAVSRAVRTPSRGEHDLVLEQALGAGSSTNAGLPLYGVTSADKDFESEELIAYELGYRWRPSTLLGLDLSLFYNDYDKLRTVELGAAQLQAIPFSRLVIPTRADNLMQGHTYGMELVADWRLSPRWRLQAWYSLLKMDLDQAMTSTDTGAESLAGQSPQQQAGLRAGVDLTHDLELDLFARYVDRLPDFGVDAYLELDARLGWQISRRLNLALVGRNLLKDSHQEFGDELLGSPPHKIERELFLRAELRF